MLFLVSVLAINSTVYNRNVIPIRQNTDKDEDTNKGINDIGDEDEDKNNRGGTWWQTQL